MSGQGLLCHNSTQNSGVTRLSSFCTRPSGDPPSEKGLRLRFLNIRARTTKCIDAAVIETAQVTGTLAEQPKN